MPSRRRLTTTMMIRVPIVQVTTTTSDAAYARNVSARARSANAQRTLTRAPPVAVRSVSEIHDALSLDFLVALAPALSPLAASAPGLVLPVVSLSPIVSAAAAGGASATICRPLLALLLLCAVRLFFFFSFPGVCVCVERAHEFALAARTHH